VLTDVDCGPTSTTGPPLPDGSVAGSGFGCTAGVPSAGGSLLPTSLPDGVLDTDRFGFFCVTTASDASEPDFLSLTVSDFVSVLVLSLPFDSSSPTPEDWEGSVVPDGDAGD